MGIVLSSIVFGSSFLLLIIIWKVLRATWWEPRVLRKCFEKQGVPCKPYRFLVGDLFEMGKMEYQVPTLPPLDPHSHDQLGPRILPHFYHFKNVYGELFVSWLGFRPLLVINNPTDIKEILWDKSGHFTKMKLRPPASDLPGRSVATLEGEEWAQHRRIVGPAFLVEKLKAMTRTMTACVSQALDNWESQISDAGKKEIDVHEQFMTLTADVISCTAFGSSYEDGRLVFKLQQEQQKLMKKHRLMRIPGYRYLPTPTNWHASKIKSQIERTLMKIIKRREEDPNDADDLLGILLAASRSELKGTQKNVSLSMQGIMDECKTFFLAGQLTTATLLTWTTMLLAIYPEWQEKARDEVLQSSLDKSHLTYESFRSLKIVGMVINEALRLYLPTPAIMRVTTKEIVVGKVRIPANTSLLLNIFDMHHNAEYWGPDVYEFKPERFAQGIVNACSTSAAFMPFSMGPRYCVGQNFALLEAKITFALMLQRFRFSLSQGYKHSPISVNVQPAHGVQIIFEKL